MANLTERILPVDIEEEMKGSYIDYSMSVIVSRALPDVRDGMKPVHRRILFGMRELGLASNRAYKKSARIVGEVLGKYHPHGDTAVYDTLVRMAQDFSMRYPLVDGQGNFGSVDGDSPAAMRYTEARLAPISEEILRDLEKDTVDFVPNFDESLKEPTVLPSVVPNLLINGASGIAVGMATNIPPHNLGEVVDGLIALIKNPDLTSEKLMKFVKAPDFPTGGIIYGYDGVRSAYKTGRGRIVVRARANIETLKGDRKNIIITEIPYYVNKSTLIERIADLVRNRKIEDITDIRDESDRDGMRVVVTLKRDAMPEIILNNLFKYTQMQQTFGVIMLALVDGRPKVLNLKDMMQLFLKHRNEVIVRRSRYELDQAEKRAHILEGYIIALDNIDAVIQLIKKAKDVDSAKKGLMKKFKLSDVQAKAILDMRLQRLTGLERKKIEEEYRDTIKTIERLKAILKSKQLQMEIIREELVGIKKKYADERRTEIVKDYEELSIEDMIAEEDVVITVTHNGFIKRFPVSGYRRQSRGGRGVTAATTRDDDFVEHMFIASTHHHVLFFSDRGKCYGLKVHEIPEGGRASRGRSIAHLLDKKQDEYITSYISVKEFSEDQFILMVTEQGLVKKSNLSLFGNPRKSGIIAISLRRNDRLKDVRLTDGKHDIVIGTWNGMAIRFNEDQIRDMGRSAAGVRGVKLGKGDRVVGAVSLRRLGTTILVATNKGFGKRSELDEYRVTRRGGKGIRTVKVTEKTGNMVAIREVTDKDDIVIVTHKGMTIRQHVKTIRIAGRNTQGVRLIKLGADDVISDVAVVFSDEEDEIAKPAPLPLPEAPAPQSDLFDPEDVDRKKAKTTAKSERKRTPVKTTAKPKTGGKTGRGKRKGK